MKANLTFLVALFCLPLSNFADVLDDSIDICRHTSEMLKRLACYDTIARQRDLMHTTATPVVQESPATVFEPAEDIWQDVDNQDVVVQLRINRVQINSKGLIRFVMQDGQIWHSADAPQSRLLSIGDIIFIHQQNDDAYTLRHDKLNEALIVWRAQ